jgi:23S rRNA pseudouridine1911/1915/1917 synthase
MKKLHNRGLVYKDTIYTKWNNKPIIRYYTEKYKHFTLKEWEDKFSDNCILANGKVVPKSYMLNVNDKLEYRRKPWVEPDVSVCFSVCYEDEHLVVVNKPVGLPVLPKGDFLENTLLMSGRKRFGKLFTPMHRIDRGTSGCVLCAKTKFARKVIGKQMQLKQISKNYLAIVQGILDREPLLIDKPIGVTDYGNLGQVAVIADRGKKAITKVTKAVINREHNVSLLFLRLETGRTHQIRIHLAYAGFPLFGENFYTKGGKLKNNLLQCNGKRDVLPGDIGFYLHSYQIEFKNIVGKVKKVTAPYPDKFKVFFKES